MVYLIVNKILQIVIPDYGTNRKDLTNPEFFGIV